MKRATKKWTIFKITALLLCLIVFIGAVTIVCIQSVCRTFYPLEYPDIVEKYSEQYSLNKELLYAVIRTESNFNPGALSNADALGLTQITPDTFIWLQSKTGETLPQDALLDADTSVRYGALFLKMLIDEFGDEKTAIAAYHAGRGQVNTWLADKELSLDGKTLTNIPFKETNHYVNKVFRAINIYKTLYDF